MGKKIRVAVLYNEPIVGTDKGRKYITETGTLQEGPPRQHAWKVDQAPLPVGVDLSEIGVLEEMDDIKEALKSLGYHTSVFNVDSNVYRLLDYLKADRPDVVFNLVECVENDSLQEMNIAGMYELLKIPYTGAGPMALGTALNKPRVKELLAYHGIMTPKFQVFRLKDKFVLKEGMTFPLIVKPSHEDASVGISDASVVYTMNELRKRIRYIHQEFDQAALVEQYIVGRELNVALLGNKNPMVLPISEIDFSGLKNDMHKIVSYEAKWIHGTIAYDGTRGVCPAPLKPSAESQLKDIALRCFEVVGCRDYARVDVRLSQDDVPYVLEVNPNPDISDDAGFARSAKAYGLTFAQMVGRIVELALERS